VNARVTGVVSTSIAVLLWLLAVVGPAYESRHRLESEAHVDPGAHYVAIIANHPQLSDALRDRDVIGYVSDEEIDIRVGGPAQARYYLSQFALAPVLLDLDLEAHELRLLNFARSEAIDPYLNRNRLRRLVDVSDNIVLAGPRGR
jgi:hypothetical protein